MKSFKILWQDSRGFSLLEVLIALGLTALITSAVLTAYWNQHRNYIVQDDVTSIQQNARAGIDELSRHIRMAGNDLPLGLDPIIASNTDPDTITIRYRINDCDTYLSDPMPQPSAELKCATDISCFEDGQWIYIFEPDSGGGEWFEITEVQAAAFHIQHNTMVLSKSYNADAILLSMEQLKFYIDNTTDPDHPTLMIQVPGQPPAIFADNITDLQFQYRLKNGLVTDEPILVEDVREVLIGVTGRSARPDVELTTDDRYRYRSYASSVNLRNVGI